jgi:hydroxymethylglutaryl-CoA lyase
VFTAASDAFNRKNINCDIAASLVRIRPVIEQAKAAGLAMRGYVSCALGCPYQGAVAVADVVRVAAALAQMGCEEISLGDTIGLGTPIQARAMLRAVAEAVPMQHIAVHFHDTRGQALANIYACLEEGVRSVDASVAGLGGCPYARGASGNVATEDLVYLLQGLGLETGVDLDALVETGRWISNKLGREPASKLGRVKV